MRSAIQRLLNLLGFAIVRHNPSPYDYLGSHPRYNETIVNLLGYNFKIADSASFLASYQEIFVDEIYRFTTSSKAPTIIDCGANYGTSIFFLKHIYPHSKITAIEADPNIFQLLKSNICQTSFKDITLLNKAVSGSAGTMHFFSEGADGGRVHPIEGSQQSYEIECVLLDDLINGEVDFLKMDIEGEETSAICSSEKLDKVSNIFIEYHSFKDATQTLAKLLDKLSSHGFRYYINTQFCSKNPLTEEKLQLGMDLQLNIYAKRT